MVYIYFPDINAHICYARHMFDPFEIKRLVQERLPEAQIEVQDMTGEGKNFEVRVVSKEFEGKTIIQQHQMIYKALGDAVGGPIHALRINTKVA